MRAKTMLTIGAVLALLFGAALLVLPQPMMESFGLAPNATGAVLSRDLGVVLLAVAVLNWLARDAPAGPALTAVLVGNLLVQALQTAVDTYHVLTGQIAPSGWGGVGLHVLLGVGFATALVQPADR